MGSPLRGFERKCKNENVVINWYFQYFFENLFMSCFIFFSFERFLNDHSPLAFVDLNTRCMVCRLDNGRQPILPLLVFISSPPNELLLFFKNSICFIARQYVYEGISSSKINLLLETILEDIELKPGLGYRAWPAAG